MNDIITIKGLGRKDRTKIDKEFWAAYRDLERTIVALNAALNPKTTILANIMFEAQRKQ